MHEYPWQVALTSTTGTRPFCGGSIISDQWNLTAAHCVSGSQPSSVIVVIGEHIWNTTAETNVTQRRAASQIMVHSGYNRNTQDNDIALIKLTSPITFPADNTIAPVCLPAPGNLYDSVTATVTGWGTTTSGGSQPVNLYEVDVPKMTNSQCQQYYGSAITTNMICAGLAAGGKDQTHKSNYFPGDSGGPLVTYGNAAQTYMVLIGAVSWGNGCALPNYPGVYTRVGSK
ncbi:trypsin alpha-3-like [Macrobrachium nipponense]|uniref:trypsin alpha-3-like n=1 Tax=Macrobrachium nipponense TaxID=159736 RepID=UPI0030C8B428